MSADLIWNLVRGTNAGVIRSNGFTLAKEAGNLSNLPNKESSGYQASMCNIYIHEKHIRAAIAKAGESNKPKTSKAWSTLSSHPTQAAAQARNAVYNVQPAMARAAGQRAYRLAVSGGVRKAKAVTGTTKKAKAKKPKAEANAFEL